MAFEDHPIHVDLFAKGQDSSGQSPVVFSGTGENKQAQIIGEAGVPAQFITSGPLDATVSLVGGAYQSSDFVSGVSGWRLLPDTFEAETGHFRGDITGANGTFSGVLQALSGLIGGFTITASALYGGIIKTNVSAGGAGSDGVIMDQDGLRGYSHILGKVFDLPTDGSAPTFSSGIINNTVYEIDTSSVLRTSDTVGDGTSASEGILINNTGIYAAEANQTLANANIKILTNGTAEIKANVKGGQTDFNTGSGYFIGKSAGDYKLSIGSATGSHLTWDGINLRMKGSFDVGADGLINNSSYLVANLPVAPTIIGFNLPSAYA